MERPRGDITTILDLATRDSQDDYFNPIDSTNSWFHREPFITYPTTVSSQEFIHKGTGDWGGYLSFDIGALTAGDLLQAVILQIKLGHWLDPNTILKMNTGEWKIDISSNPYTYVNGLGTTLIDYAEFVVGDQTIERLDSEFIRLYASVIPDVNMLYGIACDGIGLSSFGELATNTGAFSPNRAYPTQNGVYFCLLPFFFMRTRFKELFPLVSCTEGSVRVNIKLRSFTDSIRSITGQRTSCTETPLGKTFTFNNGAYSVVASANVPSFDNFRILTYTALVNGSVRNAYIHKPFEQIIKCVQPFHFEEPLRYLVSKTNTNSDIVEIQLPLEFNHPCQEIVWVFRRIATSINNEWGNFLPIVETQYAPYSYYQPWLEYATLRINGLIVEQADGEWWRKHIAEVHRGGWSSYSNYVYGYSFARYPDEHQPSGTGNMSRTQSITLNLRVRVPPSVAIPEGFSENVGQGWEVFVYSIHYNWLRFENGICQKIYDS